MAIRCVSQGIALTDKTIKQATGNEGALINVLSAETEYLAKVMKKDINRQIFGVGSAGTLANVVTGGLIQTVISIPFDGVLWTIVSLS